jgi:retron-type reverse transcriptase
MSSTKDGCSKGEFYPFQAILRLLKFLVQNSYVVIGNFVHHQINGIPQGDHSSGHLANLTCHHYERTWVEKFPFHTLQYAISRYMDVFGIANAPYFQHIYRDIYPEKLKIRLVPNKVTPRSDRRKEYKFLIPLSSTT